MAFEGFVSGLAGFINTHATPVAIKRIGWKTYTIFRKCRRCRANKGS